MGRISKCASKMQSIFFMYRQLTNKPFHDNIGFISLSEIKAWLKQINLEITETAASTAQDIVEDNIQKLSKQGISFSLDDDGTGYSNISRIISLPFHIVKLDKSLTDKVEDPKIKTLLKNTICMLKEIGMEIVVEGAETQGTLEQFVNLKCDFIQGFYFSKPLPEQEFVEFILRSGSLACNHQKF